MPITNIIKAYIFRKTDAAYKLAQKDDKHIALAKRLLKKKIKKIVNRPRMFDVKTRMFDVKKYGENSEKLAKLSEITRLSNVSKQPVDSNKDNLNINPFVASNTTKEKTDEQMKIDEVMNSDEFIFTLLEMTTDHCNKILNELCNKQSTDEETEKANSNMRSIVTNLSAFSKTERNEMAEAATAFLNKKITRERSFITYGNSALPPQNESEEWRVLQAHVKEVKAWCDSMLDPKTASK